MFNFLVFISVRDIPTPQVLVGLSEMGLVRMCCVFLFCMSIIISPIQSLSTARIFQIFQSAPRSKSLSTRLSMNLDGKLSSPPRTFIECARQAASAAKAAIESGEMLLEVENSQFLI